MSGTSLGDLGRVNGHEERPTDAFFMLGLVTLTDCHMDPGEYLFHMYFDLQVTWSRTSMRRYICKMPISLGLQEGLSREVSIVAQS